MLRDRGALGVAAPLELSPTDGAGDAASADVVRRFAAITGAAALGTYMLSVTTDPSLAALKMRDGLMLTAFGKALFVSPLKWVVIFAPLALVLFISARINSMSLGTAQITFWAFAALMEQAGFGSVRFEPLTFGIACLHRGEKPR